jgi:hypothetical protein
MFTLITETDLQAARAQIERNLRTRVTVPAPTRSDSVGPLARLLGR